MSKLQRSRYSGYEAAKRLQSEFDERMASVLAINVPPDLEERLTELAAKAGRSPEDVVGEALLTYLEDLEDAFVAIERLQSARRAIPLEEVMRKYEAERVD